MKLRLLPATLPGFDLSATSQVQDIENDYTSAFIFAFQILKLTPTQRRDERNRSQSRREKDGACKGQTAAPLPAAKVAETRLLQGISIPHHDRKSLSQTEPIKICA